MDNINTKEYLFHAIKPYELNSTDKIKDEIKILINIITSGAIFSRRNLKKYYQRTNGRNCVNFIE